MTDYWTRLQDKVVTALEKVKIEIPSGVTAVFDRLDKVAESTAPGFEACETGEYSLFEVLQGKVPGNSQDNIAGQLISGDGTIAQSILLDLAGRSTLEIYMSTSVNHNISADVSTDNTNWITDYKTWSAVQLVKETWQIGFKYVKLKSNPVAGTHTITLMLSAGR